MTLDSTKGTSLGAEPAPDSSKSDLSKVAETEKNLNDLIVSLKAKLVRSRKDEMRLSNAKRKERHILSEKYALSRDRHHRSRDTRSRCHLRSDSRSPGVSHDRTSNWSGDYLRKSDSSRDRSRGILSREQSCDMWSEEKVNQKVVGINDGDCSEKITDVKGGHLRSFKQKIADLRRSFGAKDDFINRIKLGEREVNKILKNETSEMRKFKQNQKSVKLYEHKSHSEQVFDLNCSEQEKINKDHLRTANKMQLSAVNKLHLMDDDLSSPTTLTDNHRQTDVFNKESQAQTRRKKKRKFQKAVHKDVPKIHQPASRFRFESIGCRGAAKSSKPLSSVSQEAEVMRLKADRLRLDRFRGGLKLYASAVMEAQSKLHGLLQDLSTVSPSTVLCEGEGEDALGASAESHCGGKCKCDLEDPVANTDGRCSYGDGSNERSRYGDDHDANVDRGDDEVGNGRHDDNENGNGGHGDDDDDDDRNGDYDDDGDGNEFFDHDKDKSITNGNNNWGQRNYGDITDYTSVGEAYCNNYGNAKHCNGCHGNVNDESGNLLQSDADQLKFQKDAWKEQMQAESEATVSKNEPSLLTTLSELSAPALVPQSLISDSLDPTKSDPPSPPVLESIEELYGDSQSSDEVLPLPRQLHPVTCWPPSSSFMPFSSTAVRSETPTETAVGRPSTGSMQADDSFRSVETNCSSPASKGQLVNHSTTVSKEQQVNHSTTVSKEQLVNHSTTVSKEQLVNHSTTVSKEQQVNHSTTVSKEQLVNHSSTVSKEQLVNHSTTVSKEQLVNHSTTVSKEQLVNHSTTVSKEQLVNHSSTVSKDQLVSHIDIERINSSLISKEHLVNQSNLSLVSKEQLVSQRLDLILEQNGSSPVIVEQLTRRMDPEPNNSSPVTKVQVASKLEESSTPESSFSTGSFEKPGNEGDRSVLNLGEKLDSESIRARYANASSVFNKLSSILNARRKSKHVVDTELELLRRELIRLRLNFFLEKSKISEETKTGFSKDYGSSDGQLETTCDGSKRGESNRQLNRFHSSYSPTANDYQTQKIAMAEQLPEEAPVNRLSSLDENQPSDGTKCRSGMLAEFPESAVDLSKKVYGKREADVKSDRQLMQDVVWLDLEDSAGRKNSSLMPISQDSVRGAQNGEGRSPDMSRSLEDVPLTDFDAIIRSESSDIGDDCSGRVLNLACDKRAANSNMSLCPKKRLRQKYRDQTEQERDNMDHVEYSRFLERRYREFPYPSRDFQIRQLASPPSGSLPSPITSNQKIAVVTAHFREAEKRGRAKQNEKLLPLNETLEPPRKRTMSKNGDYYQSILSHQHKTHNRNDYQNKGPDVHRLSSHGNAITAYQTNGPIANQSNGLKANHNSSLAAKQTTNLSANQPTRISSIRRFQSLLNQAHMDSSSLMTSKTFAEFQNMGPVPSEIRSVQSRGVAQWRAADSNKQQEYGSEIARNFPPGVYIPQTGCILPTYSFPSEHREQCYSSYLASHRPESSVVERGRPRLLDLVQPVPELLMFPSARDRPEDRGLLFSMSGSGQLLSSAAAMMSPNGIPRFYCLPNGPCYGESAISPEFYMTTTNPYELTQF